MTPGVPTRVIAASCGLTAFAVALVSGLAVDNPMERVLARALGCMVVCQLVGWVVGRLGEKAIADAIEKFNASKPTPETAKGGAGAAPRPGKEGAAGA